jgi:hypothetical protein
MGCNPFEGPKRCGQPIYTYGGVAEQRDVPEQQISRAAERMTEASFGLVDRCDDLCAAGAHKEGCDKVWPGYALWHLIKTHAGLDADAYKACVACRRARGEDPFARPVPVPASRLPKAIWRVVAFGGKRRYWEPASKTYKSEAWARSAAAEYLKQGATEVRIFKAELGWVEIDS